jgi:benzoyl-CoA reductase/2-hydroxyglutaryl-CoA dehydratase subunit BcrC/BadD/HgdB
VVLPVKLDTAGSRQYLIDVLGRFRAELGEKLGVTISDSDLSQAIGVMNRIRASLSRIDEIRGERPGLLAGGDFHALVRASMIMDGTRVAQVVEEVAGELSQATAAAPEGPARKRVVLSGGVCNHPDLYSVIEEAGGAVVGDDLCTGSRYFGGLIDGKADPVAAIAGRYLSRVVCPAKHGGLSDRADHLVRLARQTRADGVIFFLLKFCDPHAFDYPYLKEALDKEKIPSMLMEVEDRLPADGQLRTRFEAFIEMI